jgi:ubiquinone/menaquinone biosynthesis C-methylase UbiE
MDSKGNKIENWDHQYEDLDVTYTESRDTPEAFAQMIGYQFIHEDIKELLPGQPNAKILEVGCGTARNAVYQAKNGYEVTCSDFATDALRLAKANFDSAGVTGTFALDDLMNSKLPANHYDCIMSFGLLEHFPDLKTLTTALTRFVRPGGIQIHLIVPKKFSTMYFSYLAWFPYNFLHFALKKRDFHRILIKSFRDFPHFESRFTYEEHCEAFRKAGNEIIRCEPQDVLYGFLRLPPPSFGNFLVRTFAKPLERWYHKTHRGKTNSRMLQFLSPAFVVVCRKNADAK